MEKQFFIFEDENTIIVNGLSYIIALEKNGKYILKRNFQGFYYDSKSPGHLERWY